MDANYSFTKRIDRVSPRSKGDADSPVLRENYYSRNGRLQTVPGTERVISTLLTKKCTGAWRYYSRETGVNTPKTISYTIDGKLWLIDEDNRNATEVLTGLNTDAYPNAAIFRIGDQYNMYVVDGTHLWEWNGNNSNVWEDKTPKQSDDSSYNPIDVIEHKDRLFLLTEKQVLVSANLEPVNFSSASDSIEIIVGSGQGYNRALRKLRDRLYFLNTEGAFILSGDVLSAVATNFSVDSVDPNTRVVTGRAAQNVENGIMYLGEDLELYTFDGTSSKLMSFNEELKSIINPKRVYLDRIVGHYDSVDKRYFLSVVETGENENNLEIVYDAVEDKIDIIRDRRVSCYCQYNGSYEESELLLGSSKANTILYANRGYNFDGAGIRHRLRTRDIYFNKGQRGRIMAFYPEIEPRGNSDIQIAYLLDGRLSNPKEDYTTLAQNGDFLLWSAGVNVEPDNWIAGTAAARSTDIVVPNSYSAYIDATLAMDTLTNWNFSYSNMYVTVSVWCKTSDAGKVQLQVFSRSDAGDVYKIVYHTGSGAWEKLSAKIYVKNNWLQTYLWCDAGSTAYFNYVEYAFEKYQTFGYFDQSLAGEQQSLGFINISNQSQFIDRVRPRINYAQGSSIAFEIDEAELNNHYSINGIGLELVAKPKIKGKQVSQ